MATRWNRALITGASSGIGREIARLLAAEGTDLVVVARDTGRLEELARELSDVDVEVLTADLSDPESTAAVERRLASVESPIDLLVNNAGFASGGPFVENDIDVEGDVLAVNVTALMRLSHAAACAMVSGGGGILNISSLAGELVAPNSAVYAATKAFVTSFTESIHQELAPHGVTATAVLPGFTRTEFQDRADVSIDDIPEWAWQSAEAVAREGLDAIAARKSQVITGRVNKVAGGLVRGAPTSVRRLAAKLSMRRDASS